MGIEDKIRKLLALSTSSNEEEAMSATIMASKLAAKHNSDLQALQNKPADYIDDSSHTSTKQEIWISNIMSGLCVLNACRHYVCIVNHPHYKDFEYRVVGRPHNVQIVFSLTKYLISTVKGLNRDYVSRYNLNQSERSTYRKQFRHAASARLYHRMLEEYHNMREKENMLPKTRALVVANYFNTEQAEINEFLKGRNLQKQEQKLMSIKNYHAYQDGDNAAKTINLGGQIHGGVRNSRQIRS